MGILRILLITIMILGLCLFYLPRTSTERKLERKLLKGIIYICVSIIVIFSAILFNFRDSLFSDSNNEQRLISRVKLSSKNTVTQLKLTKYDVNNFSNKTIANVLSKYPNVNTLILAEIPHTKAESILDLVVNTTTINNLELLETSTDTLNVLFKAIKHNSHIKSLAVSNTEVSPENIKILADNLQGNSTLDTLEIYSTSLNSRHTKYISAMINSKNKITTLSLRNNSLDSNAAIDIINKTQQNKMLQSISLSGNKIGDEAAAAIAKFITANTSLAELLLGYNNISDNGAKTIVKSLENNTNLKILDLIRNPLTDDTALFILDSMHFSKNNKTKIKLSSSKISHDIRKRVRDNATRIEILN